MIVKKQKHWMVTYSDDPQVFGRVRRSSSAAAKYINPDGTNQAWERDTMQDIAEEISDALVLLHLLREQLEGNSSPILDCWLDTVQSHLEVSFETLGHLNGKAEVACQIDKENQQRPVWLRDSFNRHVNILEVISDGGV